MLVRVDDAKTVRGWGVWRSAPHVGLHLAEIHDTRRSALASARELLRKDWGDYFVVRRIDFGRPTILKKDSRKCARR